MSSELPGNHIPAIWRNIHFNLRMDSSNGHAPNNILRFTGQLPPVIEISHAEPPKVESLDVVLTSQKEAVPVQG